MINIIMRLILIANEMNECPVKDPMKAILLVTFLGLNAPGAMTYSLSLYFTCIALVSTTTSRMVPVIQSGI